MPALLLALALLVPLHELPWTSFHGDLFAAGALGLLALRAPPRRWPMSALLVLALSLVPLVQHAAGLVIYRGDAVMASLYLGGLALAIKVGADGPGATRTLAAGVLGAAWISALIALTQAAGLLSPAAWLGPQHPEGRAVANLAQPNLLATLLSLALVAQLAVWPQGRRWQAPALLAAAALVAALALTGSRSGLIQALTVLGVALIFGPRLGLYASRGQVLVLIGTLAATAVGWGLSQPTGGRGWLHAGSAVSRWGYARLFVDAVIEAPWAGYGFNQVAVAQSRQLLLGAYPAPWTEHTHNVVLDLFVWCGLPLGSAMLALLGWIVLRAMRRAWRDPRLAPAGLGLVVLLVHAMLEYPLDYFIFLLPFGVLLGRLCDDGANRQLPALFHGAACAALASVTLLVLLDYRKLAAELSVARSGEPLGPTTATAPALLLDQLRVQVEIAHYLNGAPVTHLQPLEAASRRYAYPALIQKLSQDASARGDAALAQRLARRLGP